MVSPELIRRYPFFAGLNSDQLVTLARAAEEISVDAEYYFFREGEELDRFFIDVEGEVGIVIDLPDETVIQSVSGQLTGELATKELVVSNVSPGDMFAWSAMVPPHSATSSGKALTDCRVISFDCNALRKTFEQDAGFGQVMMQKAAQIIRQRLRDMRTESVSAIVERKN